MNPDHWRDSPSGRLNKVGRGETAYWAFVPHPLPPEVPADWALTGAVSEADRALSELAGVGRTMSNPHLLMGPFVRREAVLSSRIEGTQTDIPSLYAYEAGQLPLPAARAPAPDDAVDGRDRGDERRPDGPPRSSTSYIGRETATTASNLRKARR